MAGRVVCVGGATVDRAYRLAGPLVPGTSNPAASRTGFGGVARNVAENLARLGVAVDLVSCVGDDEGGRALVGALRSAGVGCRGLRAVPGEATADYAAVLTPGGDLAFGLAAMAVLDRLTPGALAAEAGLLAAADWVFADANLPAASLEALARRAVPGARYRLAVDAVSVVKSARLPAALDGVDLMFLNADEAAAMVAHRGRPAAAPGGAAGALAPAEAAGALAPAEAAGALVAAGAGALVAAGAGAVVLTLGAGGALVATAAGIVPVPAVPARVVDVTGAGDALVAAVIRAVMDGLDLPAAVAAGCRAAAATVGHAGAVPARAPRRPTGAEP